MPILILVPRYTLPQYEANPVFNRYRELDEGFTERHGESFKDHILVVLAEGRVIYLREMNGYHDSDFYAGYIGMDGEIKEFEYASTRGWTDANSASVDATPEILERLAYVRRRDRVRSMLSNRAKRREALAKAGVTLKQYNRLKGLYRLDIVHSMLRMMQKKLRSPFKISIVNQIRTWLVDEAPKFERPLSPKQLTCITGILY